MDHVSHTCPEHLFMSENLKDLKSIISTIVLGQQNLSISVAKLTENLGELQRLNMSLSKLIKDQADRVDYMEGVLNRQRDFMNKAIGVIGTLTLLVPIISEIIKYFVKIGGN